MKNINKYILLLLSVVLLSSCCTTDNINVIENEKIPLNLKPRQPVKLEQLQWKIIDENDIIYYSLTEDNFDKLAINLQRIQNRLYLNRLDIESYKEYYESNK